MGSPAAIVKRHLNKQAKLVGLISILFYLGLGYFLKIKLMYDYANWKANFSEMRHFLKHAHIHGLTLSFLIFFYSLMMEMSGLDDKLKKIGTYLAIAGCILIPGLLFLAAFAINLPLLSHVAIVSLLAAVALLVFGHFTKN